MSTTTADDLTATLIDIARAAAPVVTRERIRVALDVPPEASLIPGFPDYAVTRDGRVFSCRVGRYMRPGAAGRSPGYLFVPLWRDGKKHQIKVHRLVLETFSGPPPSTVHQVNHKNCDTHDNRLENLEWVTPSENIRHAIANGRMAPMLPHQRGEPHPRAKVTADDVRAIRARRANGELIAAIAKDYGISDVAVSYMVSKKTWSNVL